MISIEKYISNPCSVYAVPYWKEEKIKLPDNMIVINDNEYINSDINKDDFDEMLFFRLIHNLNHINMVILPDNFEIGTINIDSQIDDVVYVINKAYEHIKLDREQVMSWRESTEFDSDLWVYIKDKKTKQIVATGIAELGKIGDSAKEGALEWIQVLPDYHRLGLG